MRTAARALAVLTAAAGLTAAAPPPAAADTTPPPTATDTASSSAPPATPVWIDRGTVHVTITPEPCGAATIIISVDPGGQPTSLDITDVTDTATGHVLLAAPMTVTVNPATTQSLDYQLAPGPRPEPGPDLVQVAINAPTVDGLPVPDGASALVPPCPPATTSNTAAAPPPATSPSQPPPTPAGSSSAAVTGQPATPTATATAAASRPVTAAGRPRPPLTRRAGHRAPLFPTIISTIPAAPDTPWQPAAHGEQPNPTTDQVTPGPATPDGTLSMAQAATAAQHGKTPAMTARRAGLTGSLPLFALLLIALGVAFIAPTARSQVRELAARIGQNPPGRHRH